MNAHAKPIAISALDWSCSYRFDEIEMLIDGYQSGAYFAGEAELVESFDMPNGFYVGGLRIKVYRPFRAIGVNRDTWVDLPIMPDGVPLTTMEQHLGEALANAIEDHPEAVEFFQSKRAG